MSEFLFKVQQYNRLAQKGLLKRFSINCYGHQETLDKMREEKGVMFEKLKHKRGTKEWDYYFLKYMPGKDDYKKKGRKRKTRKKDGSTRKKRRKRRRTRRTRLRKIFGL